MPKMANFKPFHGFSKFKFKFLLINFQPFYDFIDKGGYPAMFLRGQKDITEIINLVW